MGRDGELAERRAGKCVSKGMKGWLKGRCMLGFDLNLIPSNLCCDFSPSPLLRESFNELYKLFKI